ncbi:MAG TPA: hypothetical protein VHU80_00740 [Polyangiaceae bacterium]|jgi:hypothetical protein|nr:hypothetical protein [Polyangiaceae bacterium]
MTRNRVLALGALACGAACSPQSHALSESTPDASTKPPLRVPPDASSVAPKVDSSVPTVPAVKHTYAPTYGAIYREVLLPNCSFEFCHGGSGLFMDLETKELGYQTLVNFPAAGIECKSTGLMHVLPGKPEQSLIYLKITTPPCGKKMPLMYTTGGMLDPRDIEQIRRWIALGAPNDDGDAAVPSDASSDAAVPSDAASDPAEAGTTRAP